MPNNIQEFFTHDYLPRYSKYQKPNVDISQIVSNYPVQYNYSDNEYGAITNQKDKSITVNTKYPLEPNTIPHEYSHLIRSFNGDKNDSDYIIQDNTKYGSGFTEQEKEKLNSAYNLNLKQMDS